MIIYNMLLKMPWIQVFKGLFTNLKIFFFSISIAMVLSYKISILLFQCKNLFSHIIRKILHICRSIPVTCQLMIFALVISRFFSFSNLFWVYFSLILNSIAYSTQVFLSKFKEIRGEKLFLLKSLGYNKYEAFSKILFYEVFQNITKPLKAEAITIFKETSLVGMVGIEDLVQVINNVSIRYFSFVFPTIILCILMYLVSILYSFIFPYHLKCIEFFIKLF